MSLDRCSEECSSSSSGPERLQHFNRIIAFACHTEPMKRAIAFAERLSDTALAVVAGVNLLFLALFVLTLVAVSGRQARATDISCDAANLMQTLSPEAVVRIRAAEAQTPNADALLYEVRKGENPPSFLFGTMHVADPRVLAMTPAARQALEQASTIVIETTDILDPKKMAAAIFGDPSLTSFTGKQSLKALFSPEDYAMLADVMRERGLPLVTVAKMRPWMISASLAVSACETERKKAGAKVLDESIGAYANENGKALVGLESGLDQIRAIAATPDELHAASLLEMARHADQMTGVFETMIALYLEGRPGAIMPMMREILPGAADDAPGYAEFEQELILKRNETMAEAGAPMLAQGGAFMAVGALHLPGEEGLVEKLRRRGFTVTAR